VVKKTPVWALVGTQSFPTKGEAEAYAVRQRKSKAQAGYTTRYEIDMNPQTGAFVVREFYYIKDSKGRLL
jgi:hypothetical protein